MDHILDPIAPLPVCVKGPLGESQDPTWSTSRVWDTAVSAARTQSPHAWGRVETPCPTELGGTWDFKGLGA